MKSSYIFVLLLFFGIASCDTEKRIIRQAQKTMSSKHSLAAAEVMRAKYPCVPTAPPDSTRFIKSIEELKNLLKRKDEADGLNAEFYQYRLKQVRDSFTKVFSKPLLTLEECTENQSYLISQVSKYKVRYDSVVTRSSRQYEETERIKRQFASQLDSIKPVIQLLKDSIDGQKCAEEIASWRLKYEIDHQWREKREAKEQGKYVWYIPKWIIWLLFALGGLSVFATAKGFNPFSLLRLRRTKPD